jgi:rSAM-associated Gly-rich repeat protein
MNTSKSFIAVALQLAACACLLPKQAKASPISTGAGDDARIGERIAKVRQMLAQTAEDQMTASKDVDGVRINWANWRKGGHGGWGNGRGTWRNGWRNGSRYAWPNGGWHNGAGFRVPPGWGNYGWPNGGAIVAPGWLKFWFNH